MFPRMRCQEAISQKLAHVVFAAFILFCASTARADGLEPESAGARFAFSSKMRNADMYQTDIFLNSNLPWRWALNENWSFQMRLDSSAGMLKRHADSAGVFLLGSSLVVRRAGCPLSLSGGTDPAILTSHKFDGLDLGGNFQFCTHAGLDLDITSHIRVGYQFQHMSNAGLYTPNPGVNLHFFGLSYVF